MKFLKHIQLNPTVSMEKGKSYPFIEMASVSTRHREPSAIDNKKFSSGVKFEDEDTVIARIEPCLQNGKKFFVRNLGKGFGSTEFLTFRPKDDSVDATFLYYFMQTDFIKKSMIASMTGATGRQRVNNEIFKTMEIEVPSIEIQKRIGQVLSSYDDLIENNRKQIALLEEAAQRLYREYFVDLRFPGCEDVTVVDGVPEGWKNEPVGNVVSYNIGGGWGDDRIKDKNDQPAFVIRGTDFSGLIHGAISSIPYRYHAESNLSSRKLQDGDIVFEVSGGSKTEGVARTLLIRKELLEMYSKPVMCASFCKLVRFEDLALAQYMYHTFQYLRSSGKTMEFDKKSASSIVNYRWKDFLSQQNVLIPPLEILEEYNRLAESYYYQIINRSKQIETLRSARDRLLPKLMSGEIEV